jgi:hypothetical protein
MKPGKNSTPRPKLDLRKLWAELKEDPPGPIQTLPERVGERRKNRGFSAALG